jgi:hypothetical protein
MLGFPPDDRWHGRSFAPRGDFLFDDTRQSVGGEQLQRHVGHGWRKLSVITVLRGMNSIVQQPLTIEGKVEGRIFLKKLLCQRTVHFLLLLYCSSDAV